MNSFKENNLRFGLYHENKLVSLMTFEKYDANLDNYVITSFCNILNTNVVNSFKILYEYFISNFKVNEIGYYIDRSWKVCNDIFQLGFKLKCKTIPNEWFITKGRKRESVSFKDFLYRLYDSGNILYKVME